MGLFRRGGISRRERRQYREHLAELDNLYEDGLERLGATIAEMSSRGEIDGPLVWEEAARLNAIEDEIELVERGITEGLTRDQLAALARGEADQATEA